MKINETKFGVAVVASIFEVENQIDTAGASDVVTPDILAKAVKTCLGTMPTDGLDAAKAAGGDVTADR